MVQQSAKQSTHPAPVMQPKRLELFLHLIKTVRLLGALLTDRKIPLTRKLLFLVPTGAFLLLLLLPDIPVVLGTILPAIGAILGIPLDAGVSWTAFALLLVNLLRIFPDEVVSQHYTRIFNKRPDKHLSA